MQIKLDFNLNGSAARLEYLNEYLKGVDPNRLTPDNIEMMSNYILWGLENEDPNLDFEIESKNSPWAKASKVSSLEAMMEQEQETGMPVQSQVSDVALVQSKRKLERAEVIQKLKPRGSVCWIRLVGQEMAQDRTKDCFAILGTLKAPSGAQGNEKEEKGLNQENETKSDEANYTQFADATLDIKDWDPLTNIWFELWSQIDCTEFMVQTWELSHGKRRADLPIRDELHIRLACNLAWKGMKVSLEEYENELRQKALEWEGYKYLKKKRALVSLRTQQYSLLDSLQGETLMRHMNTATYWMEEDRGLRNFYPFNKEEFLIDGAEERHFQKDFYDKCVEALAELDRIEMQPNLREPCSIDFRDSESVRQIILMYSELKEAAARMTKVEGVILQGIIRYLSYYIEQCNFTPELEFILRSKMLRVSNKDIAAQLKEEFNLDYKENYISTIFTKRVVEAIVEQVNLHYRLIEFITMGKSVFKKCTKCGRLLPRNATYFNRRTSTSDGFFSSCKRCKTRRKD